MTADQHHLLLRALPHHLPHHPGGLLLLLPNPRVMIITIVIATLMSTLPLLYAVARFVKMQELVQLVVLAGVIRRKIRVGIQEF